MLDVSTITDDSRQHGLAEQSFFDNSSTHSRDQNNIVLTCNFAVLTTAEVDAVLMDFDGTVFNTEDEHRYSFLKAVEELYQIEISADLKAQFESAFGLGEYRTAQVLIEKVKQLFPNNFEQHADVSDHDIVMARGRFFRPDSDFISLVPGIKEIIASLVENKIPVVLCTGSSCEIVEGILRKYDLLHFFNFELENRGVFAGDYPPNEAKPHARPWLMASEKIKEHLGLDLENRKIFVFEDTTSGALGAVRAGYKVFIKSPEDSADAVADLARNLQQRLLCEGISSLAMPIIALGCWSRLNVRDAQCPTLSQMRYISDD